MKLDTSRAWSETTATVSANKELLIAIAGVFFFLPSLALALFYPQPEAPDGAQWRDLMTIMGNYYRGAWPLIALAALVQVLGQLAVLSLTAGARQATVGDAIRAAMRGLPTYIGTQLLILGGIALTVLVLGVIGAAVPLLALVLGLVAAVASVWVSIRCLLFPVVIAVEGERNALAVLRRSWDLTRGKVGQILLFVVVLAVAVTVIAGVASTVSGIVFALIGGASTGRIAGDAAAALVGAAASTYFAISFAAIHRQLAGTAGQDRAVFE